VYRRIKIRFASILYIFKNAAPSTTRFMKLQLIAAQSMCVLRTHVVKTGMKMSIEIKRIVKSSAPGRDP